MHECVSECHQPPLSKRAQVSVEMINVDAAAQDSMNDFNGIFCGAELK
jgi:hypothetical protein